MKARDEGVHWPFSRTQLIDVARTAVVGVACFSRADVSG